MLSFDVPVMFCLNEDIKCVRFLVVDVVALHVSFLVANGISDKKPLNCATFPRSKTLSHGVKRVYVYHIKLQGQSLNLIGDFIFIFKPRTM